MTFMEVNKMFEPDYEIGDVVFVKTFKGIVITRIREIHWDGKAIYYSGSNIIDEDTRFAETQIIPSHLDGEILKWLRNYKASLEET